MPVCVADVAPFGVAVPGVGGAAPLPPGVVAGLDEPKDPFIARSKGLPGDLGVLEEPKLANAPDPNPNALEALVGLASVAAEAEVLKGFLFPCEEVSPRREKEPLLRPKESPGPGPPVVVESESLLEL